MGGGERESDSELKFKIRPIDFVMHNPNLFWISPSDTESVIATAGGIPFLLSTGAGIAFSVLYYKLGTRVNPVLFYDDIMKTWGRIFMGAVVGGGIGFMRFGDRQRLHNAYTSYRLRRRYKDSINIETTELWKLKGHKPHEPCYEWQ